MLEGEHLQRLATQVGAPDQLVLGSIGVHPKQVHAVLAIDPMRLHNDATATKSGSATRLAAGWRRAQAPTCFAITL